MPQYDWKCVKCEKEITNVTQSFSEYNTPPEEKGDEKCPEHKWQKQLGSFKLSRGKNWSGRKGHW